MCCVFVCECVRVCAFAQALVRIEWSWNRSPVEKKTSVPDRRKQPYVVMETNIFTRLQIAGRSVNPPLLPNAEVKERLVL
jgi:hypothetical protein